MCNCNCEKDYPCSWSFSPSIYISADAPLDANGMSVKLKLGDGVYINENGELCAIGGSGETGVDDVKVNGSSVVSNRIAVIDLTPYALSAVVQSQVNDLETKVETISAETTPYSGASGVVVNDHTISVSGGHFVSDIVGTRYADRTTLNYAYNGGSNNMIVGHFGLINGTQIFSVENSANSFTLLENVSVPRGVGRVNVPIVDNAAQLPAGDSNVYGVVMVDNAINSASTNPVQNNVIKAALDEKANGAYTLLPLTQAEYDALPVKDENTIYLIKEA